MRFFSIALLGLLLTTSSSWETDFEKAQQKAQAEHKYILISFSGSDWCIPCIRLHKEIFDSEAFKTLADNSLILVNADFPRLKKNQLSKDQQQKNDKLADKYNQQGSFPLTVLTDEQGKVIRSWEGYPDLTPEQFTEQIKTLVDGRK
jgi:thioredoxin-related protein